jgi:hypothetical protein
MSVDLEKLATVLEKTADYLDAQEHEKTAAAQNERRQVVDSFAEKYASATGEELSDDVLNKLTNSDLDLVDTFQKLAARIDGGNAPDDMGEPGDLPDGDPIYSNKKEAAAAQQQAAGDKFLSWIMSD